MQFTIMIFETAQGFAARTAPDAGERYWPGTFAFLAALQQAGIFRGGAGLMPPASAKVLRLSADGTDWQAKAPAEPGASEQLGGYFIIEVPTLEDAVAWAARFPRRPGAAVEVRPNLPSER